MTHGPLCKVPQWELIGRLFGQPRPRCICRDATQPTPQPTPPEDLPFDVDAPLEPRTQGALFEFPCAECGYVGPFCAEWCPRRKK